MEIWPFHGLNWQPSKLPEKGELPRIVHAFNAR